MKSRLKIGIAIGIIAIISVATVWYFQPKTATYTEGFEESFGGWKGDTDVPQDPNNPDSPVEWNILRVTYPVKSGQYSAELYIDGRQDDGTIWIEKELSVKQNSQIQVTVSFEFYSESESFNTIAAVVGFAGTYNPEVEGDFTVLGPANMVSGWKNYTHTSTLKTDSSGEAWVAVGISVLWETEMSYNLDDVKVTIS
jgi:hypothetical protein